MSAFDRKWWNLSKLVGSAPFPEVNAATFDLYFHDRDIDYGHGYKENFKVTFVTRSGTIMWKGKKKMWKYWQKDESIYYHYGGKDHLSCTYYTPKHLTNNEKNIETHFAY